MCRKKCLIYVPNMENFEISLVAKGVDNFLDVQSIANDEGQWMPNLTSELKGFDKFILDLLSKALKNIGTTRHQRIGIEKKIFKRDRLTDFGFQLISQNRNSLNEALAMRFPLTEKFWNEDLFLQFLRGKITESQLLKELQQGFIDPTNFIGWYINIDKKALGIPKHFRNVSATNIDKLRILQNQYIKLHDLGVQASKSEKELQQNVKKIKNKMVRDSEGFRKRHLNKVWVERRQDLLKLGVTKKLWDSNVKTSTLGQTPSIDFHFHALLTYIMDSVSNPQNSRKLSNSDNGDLMHGRYLPYVDIFRADRYMGNLFKRIAKRYNTKVVTSFVQLPEIIKSMK